MVDHEPGRGTGRAAGRGARSRSRASRTGGRTRAGGTPLGVAAADLSDDALVRELASLHRTRHDALRHRPGPALGHHDRRSHELEAEYLRRFPDREVPGSWPGRERRDTR